MRTCPSLLHCMSVVYISHRMAKARVVLPSGLTVNVEGTPAEILAVVQDLEGKEKAKSSPKAAPAARKATARPRTTLAALLQSLNDDGFFAKPRDLGSIKLELETRGHFYPVTTLSGAVLTEVRKRKFRRLK